jgi:predicted GIY-YIG superfamily endonuclease
MMHPKFAEVMESLHPSFERLMAMEPLRGTPPSSHSTPKSGVYLFSEQEGHLYVGRSNRILERYKLHCGVSAKQNQASFAWKLMAEVVGHKATYRKGQGRADLILRPDYADAFSKAKARIRNMDYRFVEENDQMRQALLEAYVCIALDTPYNDFNTH